MNKLQKNITENFFIDTDYQTMVSNWKAATKEKKALKAADNLLYCVLRGKNWRRAFTPIKDQKTLLFQHKSPYFAYGRARSAIKYGFYNKDVFGKINVQLLLQYLPEEAALYEVGDDLVYNEVSE